jgi:hypothetical protein
LGAILGELEWSVMSAEARDKTKMYHSAYIASRAVAADETLAIDEESKLEAPISDVKSTFCGIPTQFEIQPAGPRVTEGLSTFTQVAAVKAAIIAELARAAFSVPRIGAENARL